MNSKQKKISVYPPLSPLALIWSQDKSWRESFPFSEPSGFWGFCGRVGLYHGLDRLNLRQGSTILVPVYFQGTEIDTLVAKGFKLKYYKIDKLLNADLGDIENKLNDEVTALYIIHYFGFPQPIDMLLLFCRDNNLKLIEDCALSLYSKHKDAWLGSFGDLSFFSVYKTIALPHGGFAITKDVDPPKLELTPPSFMSTMVQSKDSIFNYLQSSSFSFIASVLGLLSRLIRKLVGWNREQTISSGVAVWDKRLIKISASKSIMKLMGQMSMSKIISKRRENYLLLDSLIKEHFTTIFPELPDGVCPLFYPIIVDNRIMWNRKLKESNIGTATVWLPHHPSCPDEIAQTVSYLRENLLELPIHQSLNENDIRYIAETIIDLKAKGF